MNAKLKSSLQLIIATAALGWINALYTLIHRQGLLAHGLEEQSLCHIGSAFNCDAVALSSYSAFLGIPVSAFGMCFYSVVVVLALWAYFLGQDREEKKLGSATSIILGLTAFCMIPTLALAAISVFAIKTICLMCLLTYILDVALFGLALRARNSETSLQRHGFSLAAVPQALWLISIGLVVLQLFSPKIVESSISDEHAMDSATIDAYVARHHAAPARTIVTEGLPTMGPANAPITVVEFSDFQCPHCKKASLTLPPLLMAYGKNVKLVFKNFPLDSGCNAMSGLQAGMHPFACQAAKTGHCVHKYAGNDAFFAYTDEVFANQTTLSSELIEKAGERAGVNDAKLRECMGDFATHQAILDQAAEGAALGIQGTPTIYVNGRVVETGATPRVLKPIIESYLK